MADIYGSHFEYGGISSRLYGLIIASVNSDRMTKLSGDYSGETIFNRITKSRYLVGDDMSNSPIEFDIEIVSDDDRCLTVNQRRDIEKWLFNRHDYRKLYFDESDDCSGDLSEYVDGDLKRLYINCRMVNPEKLEYNGGIVGYRATLEADSCMFWQDEIEKSFVIDHSTTDEVSVISVDVDTDIDDYLYPKVSFTLGDIGGTVIISNTTDNSTRLTKFVGLSPYTTITIRGDINFVSGQNYQKFSERNFPRLLDGRNSITVLGNIHTIKFVFQNRRNIS